MIHQLTRLISRSSRSSRTEDIVLTVRVRLTLTVIFTLILPVQAKRRELAKGEMKRKNLEQVRWIADAAKTNFTERSVDKFVCDLGIFTFSSVPKLLGDDCLRHIAQDLVDAVRRSVTIDWTVRENARAKIRVIVKRILKKYGYPPDKQEKATQTVLEQAEVLCREWAV